MASHDVSTKTPTKTSRLLNISPKSTGCVCIICGNFTEVSSRRRKLFVGNSKTDICILIEKLLNIYIARECSTHIVCIKCTKDVSRTDNTLKQLILSYEKTKQFLYESHGHDVIKRLRPQDDTDSKSSRRKALFQDTQSPESTVVTCDRHLQQCETYSVDIVGTDGLQRTVVQSLTPLALALASSDFVELSSVILSIDELKSYILDGICDQLQKELICLCSKQQPSVLRNRDLDSLLKLTWQDIASEWTAKAPSLWAILRVFSANPSVQRNKHKDVDSNLPSIVSAGSKLVSVFNRDLNALKHLNNVILMKGGAKKSLFNRLSVTGDCSSYNTSLNDLEKFAKEWDTTILEWKHACENDNDKEKELEENVVSARDVLTEKGAPPDLVLLRAEEENALRCHRKQMHNGYYFVGDNVDFYTKVRHMSSTNQNKSQHMYQMCAYKNRVSGNDLEDSSPKADASNVSFSVFLPSDQDQSFLLDELAQIVAWKWTEHIPSLQCFSPVLPQYISHKYMPEMRVRTERINLGVLEKNEQYNDDMTDICEFLHTFVPGHDESNDFRKHTLKVLSGGDYLTFERQKQAQMCKSNARTPSKRFQGLIPKMEEFHNQAEFLKLIWGLLYKTTSSHSPGTLYAARNRIDAKNVPVDPHNDFYAAATFMDKVTSGHIISGGLSHFQMKSLESKPQPEYLGPVGDKECMRKYIMEHARAFVKKHGLPHVPKLPTHGAQSNECVCRYCKKLYHRFKSLRKHEALVHDHPDPLYNPQVDTEICSPLPDKSTVHDYTKLCLTLGLLRLNHNDAIKMGDGERMMRIAKYFCLYYKACKCPKYAFGLLETIAQSQVLLSPRQAERLVWNRTVNHQGKPDTNHPNDLDLEHCNKVFKEDVHTYRGKYTEKTILRVSRSALTTDKICKKYDKLLQVRQSSGKHTQTNVTDDILLLVDQFHRNGQVFNEDGDRVCETFDNLSDPLKTLDMQNVQAWISNSLKTFAKKSFYK